MLFAVRLVAFVNFALLCVGAWWFGGDAFNGRVEGGHYFLGSHGDLVEVSHAVWVYSRVHVISNFVTFALALIALEVMGIRRVFASSTDSDGTA
ncbi:MAG TPA: hypothetical protein VGR07_02935 [Thermoanaerobaculia bacterium]|nr:hypothetical protein [Thermoanaerobaculia bacterium]